LLFCAGFCCLTTVTGFAQDWQTVVKTWGPAVGKIELKNKNQLQSTGTGFIVDNAGRMLTNAHVVSQAHLDPGILITVTFPFSDNPKQEHIATITRISDELDLAVLTTGMKIANPCQLDSGPIPQLMSPVLVVGYPLGKSFKATPGFLQAIQDMDQLGAMLDLSAAVDFGNSGGPVFGSDGKVIGIATAKIFGLNFNLALPIRTAIAVLAGDDEKRVVQISSNPPGARLFVNGNYKGLTPLSTELYTRDHEFMLEKDGYKTLTKTSKPLQTGNDTLEFTLEPQPSPYISVTITTTPAGADVIVNNVSKGKSPVTIETERGSKLRIRAKIPFRNDIYQEVVVEQDKDRAISLTFE